MMGLRPFLLIGLIIYKSAAEKSFEEESRQLASNKQDYLGEAFNNYYYSKGDKALQYTSDSEIYDNNIDDNNYHYISDEDNTHASKVGSENSPALSALALLGFLYFLNLIQSVLQNSSGKRKRDVEGKKSNLLFQENISSQLESIESVIDKVERSIRGEKYSENEGNCLGCGRSLQDRASRVVSSISHFFGKLKEMLGFGSSISRSDTPGDSYSSSSNIWSSMGHNIHRVSTIMNFLSDPRPTRIHRSYDKKYNYPHEESDMVTDDTKETYDTLHREKRYTDKMNVWYEKQHKGDRIDGSGLILNAFMNLLKNAGRS